MTELTNGFYLKSAAQWKKLRGGNIIGYTVVVRGAMVAVLMFTINRLWVFRSDMSKNIL
jgi:hypothetical protein